VIKKLKAKAARADAVYLATDPDREGEAISWHLLEQVVGKTPYHRVTYTEITETAIKAAIANPRKLDMPLVEAQRSRQVLDKLAGYELSRIVQQAGAGKSAGRVQSAALHILCERERTITRFKATPYWTITSSYSEGFSASYIGSDAKSAAEDEPEPVIDEAADPDEAEEFTGSRVTSEAEATAIVKTAQSNAHKVIEFTVKQATKNAPPALTTSALQQAAGVKYGFSSEQTMQIAQSLFEGVDLPDGSRHGAITYHRTDSVSLAPEFCESVQQWLRDNHPDLVPAKTTARKNKAGSQGAHEAIRPVEVRFTPEQMKAYLDDKQHKVYTLIWQRAVASLCAPAQIDRAKAVIQSGNTFWQATGSVAKFPGYAKILGGLGGDKELPNLAQEQGLTLAKCEHTKQMTKPPGRYSEPKLVQTMERLGIGRPSTYASIMKTLKDREYVTVKGKLMVPTQTGLSVDECLMQVFPAVCDSTFTAKMEGDLDLISEGKKPWEKYIADFYFNCFAPALEKNGTAVVQASRKVSDKPCGRCGELLIEQPYKPKFAGAKPCYLRCSDGCEGEVYFFNNTVKDWVKKGTVVEKPAPKPGKPTEFVCQFCGKNLEEHSYSKDGQTKTMLRCSDPDAWKDEKHKAIGVYFMSSKGNWWNPTLFDEAHTEKIEGGDQPKERPAGAKSSSSNKGPSSKSGGKAKSSTAKKSSASARKK
jgi:DNA topoisomerase-1